MNRRVYRCSECGYTVWPEGDWNLISSAVRHIDPQTEKRCESDEPLEGFVAEPLHKRVHDYEYAKRWTA